MRLVVVGRWRRAGTQAAANSGWAVLKVFVWPSKEDRVCLMKMRLAVNRLSPGVTRREAVVTGVRIPTDRQTQRHRRSRQVQENHGKAL